MLVETHGGEKMDDIRQSLERDGRHSPYFRETLENFRVLKGTGGTEMQLRKEWQGRLL